MPAVAARSLGFGLRFGFGRLLQRQPLRRVELVMSLTLAKASRLFWSTLSHGRIAAAPCGTEYRGCEISWQACPRSPEQAGGAAAG